MKLLKKLTLVVLLISLSTGMYAQKKMSSSEKRATFASEYVAEKMGLDKEKETLLLTIFTEKFEANSSQINGQNLTLDQKKVIFAKNNKIAQKKMLEKFSKKEIQEINKYQQESNKAMASKKKPK